MTTFDDPIRSDDLEHRLRSWMGGEAAAPPPVDAVDAVLRATASIHQRPIFLVSRSLVRTTPPSERTVAARRFAFGAVAALLAVALATAGLLVGMRLIEQPQPQILPGFFVRAGSIPATMGDISRPAVAALTDGRILIAGGGQESPSAVIWDPTTGGYGTPIPMHTARHGATATTLRDGRVLVVGGTDQWGTSFDSAEIFEPMTGAFVATGSMAEARDGHTATLLADGRVLVVGGSHWSAPDQLDNTVIEVVADAEIYDPSTETFQATGPLAAGRTGHTATLLPDGRVVILGGEVLEESGQSHPIDDASIYDPATRTFTSIGRLGTPRTAHLATLLPDGRILVVGGDATTTLASAELFDPGTGQSVDTGSMTTERADASGASLPDGRILVVGGRNDFGNPRTAEVYDPVTGQFSPAGAAEGEHEIGVAPVLADGRVFLPGPGEAPQSGSELFVVDPVGRVAPVVATPPTEAGRLKAVENVDLRSGATATPLEDGRILIAGGWDVSNNATQLASAELFDPATSRTTPTGAMVVPREFHQAIRLPDGRVLVAGGDSRSSAEIYDPSTGTFSLPSREVQEAFRDRDMVSATGMPVGRIVLADQEAHAVLVLDVMSGILSPPMIVCQDPSSAAGIDSSRLIVLCGQGPNAWQVDPALTVPTQMDLPSDLRDMFVLDDGRILLTHAIRDGEDRVRQPIGIFDRATGTVSPISFGERSTMRAGSIVELADGRVLIVGGSTGGRPDRAISLLDPDTGEIRAVDPLLWPRRYPALVRLEDGRVLIVGGADRSPDRTDPVPPGAEIFDPTGLP